MVESTWTKRRKLPLEQQDPVTLLARRGARLVLERALEEEIEEHLGARRYERVETGARKGYRSRDLVVGLDVVEDLRIPRAVLHGGTELRSRLLPERCGEAASWTRRCSTSTRAA